jgi:hypothetical protein
MGSGEASEFQIRLCLRQRQRDALPLPSTLLLCFRGNFDIRISNLRSYLSLITISLITAASGEGAARGEVSVSE